MALRIALDLDNTLIDYGALFTELARERGWIDGEIDKPALRAKLVAEDGHDRRWQELQAAAYGTHILRAKAAAGAKGFVAQAIANGHEVVVVSHKTERSSFDPNVELREAALGWLDANGLDLPTHFFDTKQAKARAVAELRCAWVVDDLRDVLELPEMPDVVRIWLARDEVDAAPLVRCASFVEVAALLALHDALGARPTAALRAALGPSPRAIEPIGRPGGNARIRVVVDASGARRVVKSYARGGERAAREARALRWMRAVGVENVPELLFVDADAQLAVLEHVDGERPTAERIDDVVLACAAFALRLAELGRTAARDAFGDAADARLRLSDHPRAIERRLGALRDRAKDDERARRLFETRVAPAAERVLARFAERVVTSNLDVDAELPALERIPSPSDFGVHNVVVDRYDRPWFVDFEYFGWDDPAKLMADFLHTVAEDVPRDARERFVEVVAGSLPDGERARRRLDVISEIVAFEWVLIVLNVLEPARIARAEAMLEAFA